MSFPLDAERKLNGHNTFRKRPGRLLSNFYEFVIRPVPRGFTLTKLKTLN